MTRFQVGDKVERTGSLVPQYMKKGTVVAVIPNMGGQDHFTQYEVDFGKGIVVTFYETQLRPARSSD